MLILVQLFNRYPTEVCYSRRIGSRYAHPHIPEAQGQAHPTHLQQSIYATGQAVTRQMIHAGLGPAEHGIAQAIHPAIPSAQAAQSHALWAMIAAESPVIGS